MADTLDFLDRIHPIYKANVDAWKRDERRLIGQDAALQELTKWKGESDDHYRNDRQATAGYLNFPKSHAGILSGHLNRKYPTLNYGDCGEVRTRDKIDTPTLAELFDYNCDGIGNDGTQLKAFMDGVEQRAIATGHRWLLMEMPNRAALREIRLSAMPPRNPDVEIISERDQIEGFRAYLVEHLLAVKDWKIVRGVLQRAVLRIPIEPENDLDATEPKEGYYLLVRRGYTRLGTRFRGGGWWIFDGEKKELATGRWDDTLGQIPMWRLFARRSEGTKDRPAMSESLTMELGQIAVGIMNLRSARDYNLIQAGKSIYFILGGDESTHAIVIKQHEDGSIVVTVPPVMFQDGKVGIPQLWNSAEAAIATGAFKDVIASSIEEAKEIMVRQVTSAPESSGVSVDTHFAEATSPLLASLAANREASDNTMLYFYALRSGKKPNGSVTWPQEFPLKSVVDDIDAMLDTLKRSQLSAPTLEKKLVMGKLDETDIPLSDGERTAIERELTDSMTQREDQKAQTAAAFAGIAA